MRLAGRSPSSKRGTSRRYRRERGARDATSDGSRDDVVGLVNAMNGSETKAKATETPLMELGALESRIVLRRPSARNRSPYIVDVRVMERERG